MFDKIITYIITAVYIIFTIVIFKKERKKITVKQLCVASGLAAIAVVFNSLVYIPSIWGSAITFGGIAIMLSGYLLGPNLGMLTGLISGLGMVLFGQWQVIHPLQFFTEVYLCNTALGLTGLFGSSKSALVKGSILAIILALIGHILTGIIFYKQFAVDGMSFYTYSIVYNLLSEGVSMIIGFIVLLLLPIKNIKDLIGENENE